MKNYNTTMREINRELNYLDFIVINNTDTNEELIEQKKMELLEVKRTLVEDFYLNAILNIAIKKIEKRVSSSLGRRWILPQKEEIIIELDEGELLPYELMGFKPIFDKVRRKYIHSITVNYEKIKDNAFVLDNRNSTYRKQNEKLIQALIHELTHSFVFTTFRWDSNLLHHTDSSIIFMMWLAWISEGKERNGYVCWKEFKTTELYTDVLQMDYSELLDYTYDIKYLLLDVNLMNIKYKGYNIKVSLQYSNPIEVNEDLTVNEICNFDNELLVATLSLPTIINGTVINSLASDIKSYIRDLIDNDFYNYKIENYYYNENENNYQLAN